jgi:hypothetical protein
MGLVFVYDIRVCWLRDFQKQRKTGEKMNNQIEDYIMKFCEDRAMLANAETRAESIMDKERIRSLIIRMDKKCVEKIHEFAARIAIAKLERSAQLMAAAFFRPSTTIAVHGSDGHSEIVTFRSDEKLHETNTGE